MKVSYNGSHGSVDVPALGLFGVDAGEPTEIDDLAGSQLLAQGWSLVHEDDENEDDENDRESDG